MSTANGQTPLQNLTDFVTHVEGAIAFASNNEDAALAAIAEVEHRLVAYLKYCAESARGSGSDFNQGVVRGLEIAAAQVEHGHYQRWDESPSVSA